MVSSWMGMKEKQNEGQQYWPTTALKGACHWKRAAYTHAGRLLRILSGLMILEASQEPRRSSVVVLIWRLLSCDESCQLILPVKAYVNYSDAFAR